MHEVCTDAEVIWYDAVTVEGKLQWQDNLTELNQDFFRACDGLYVNYTWKAKTPSQARAAAGESLRSALCVAYVIISPFVVAQQPSSEAKPSLLGIVKAS